MVVKPFWDSCRSGINPSPSHDFLLSLTAEMGFILTTADGVATGLAQIPLLSSDEIQPNQVEEIQTSEGRPVISNTCSGKTPCQRGDTHVSLHMHTHIEMYVDTLLCLMYTCDSSTQEADIGRP